MRRDDTAWFGDDEDYEDEEEDDVEDDDAEEDSVKDVAEEEEDEEEDEGTVIEAQLRHIWHLVADGATESIEKGLPLHIQL